MHASTTPPKLCQGWQVYVGEGIRTKDNVRAQIFRKAANALSEVLRWKFGKDITYVEHHGHITVVLALQVGVLAKSHDRSIADSRLIPDRH